MTKPFLGVEISVQHYLLCVTQENQFFDGKIVLLGNCIASLVLAQPDVGNAGLSGLYLKFSTTNLFYRCFGLKT